MTQNFWFFLSSATVSVGCFFVGVLVVPRMPFNTWRSRLGGSLFFIATGLYYLDELYRQLFTWGESSLTIRGTAFIALQAVAVWVLAYVLYIETIKVNPFSDVWSDHERYLTGYEEGARDALLYEHLNEELAQVDKFGGTSTQETS